MQRGPALMGLGKEVEGQVDSEEAMLLQPDLKTKIDEELKRLKH
jgi:hypothetical protein